MRSARHHPEKWKVSGTCFRLWSLFCYVGNPNNFMAKQGERKGKRTVANRSFIEKVKTQTE